MLRSQKDLPYELRPQRKLAGPVLKEPSNWKGREGHMVKAERRVTKIINRLNTTSATTQFVLRAGLRIDLFTLILLSQMTLVE
jgi:hypothetical protein